MICEIAWGPPVEMPITTQARTRPESPEVGAVGIAGRGGAIVDAEDDDDEVIVDRRGRRTRLCAAVRILEVSRSLSPRISASWLRSGLGRKSTAPSSRAWRVTSAPSLVKALTITTLASWMASREGRASRPETSGIWTSSVITSGLSRAVCTAASRPSRAVPTTSISGLEPRISERIFRIRAESSTTRTRTRFEGGPDSELRPANVTIDLDALPLSSSSSYSFPLDIANNCRCRAVPARARQPSLLSRLRTRSREKGLTMKSIAPSRIDSIRVSF